MKITSSYAVEIKKQKMFDNTIKIYREAVSFLIGCFNKEWDSIQKVEGAKSRKSFAEKLIHTTKYSTAKYDFDAKFYKFPSYLRRAAIQAALGSVSSYRSNYKNWEANGKVDRKPKLQCDVHHLESRKVGGNAPSNLITLCTTCHNNLHKGKITLDGKKRGKTLRDAAFMGIMRNTLLTRLRNELNIPVQNTYGYITKLLREQNDIKKSHVNDARCISKHPLAKPCSVCYRTKAIRHHNRQIHKAKILKGGIRKANQAPYIVKGFRLWDKVLYNEQECFISGRRSSGYFALRKFDGTTITNSISFKKLRLLEPATNYLIERK